ncbi:helix-turn-helix domain-containing protein [bacterium]|nr:helix-turn-helix domain-containing protein [bacterium]
MLDDQQKAQLRELMELRDEYKSDPSTPDFVFEDLDECIDNLLNHGRAFMFDVTPVNLDSLREVTGSESVLTVKESARVLGTSPQSVRNMIRTGKLKATQIGTGSQRKAYTIKRSDLDALAKIQEEPAAKPKRRKNNGQDDNRWGL